MDSAKGSGRGDGERRACEDCSLTGLCRLADARPGDCMTIRSVDEESARVAALRFGVAEGSTVSCIARLPGGPIVLKRGRQEIAVGRRLAERIAVTHHEEA